MDSKFQSKFRVLDTDDVKQKTSLFYVQGKSAWALFHGFSYFVLLHLCPVLKVNDQTLTTVILACVAGVRKGTGRGKGIDGARPRAREEGVPFLSPSHALACPNSPFPF